MHVADNCRIGISAISAYEPPGVLDNDWFDGAISRKFVQHTGTRSRRISWEGEVAMGVRAAANLRDETDCDLRDCAAVVFVSPSFVPLAVAKKHLAGEDVGAESVDRAARRFVSQLGLSAVAAENVLGMNWFCSGYSKALALVRRRILSGLELTAEQFILVVTVSQISRITDYGCKQTAPLFGDMATATLLSRTDSRKYPVRFKLLAARAQKQAAGGVFFDYELRRNVLLPTSDGGRNLAARRLVFSLDGMGIADAAPLAMSDAFSTMLQTTGLRPEDVQFVVPHQAGTGIVRLAAMKLEEIGVRGAVINGLTSQVGNVSSCSVPYALKKAWDDLDGTIACPTAGVGAPGKAEVSQGCILLRAVPRQRRRPAA